MSEVPQLSNSLGRWGSLLSEMPHGLIVMLNKCVHHVSRDLICNTVLPPGNAQETSL